MSELGPIVLELTERPWSELDPGERGAFQLWLEGAQREDLYMLLRAMRTRARRPRRSSSQTFAAQRELAAPHDPGETE